jgi:hypothetical protein
MRAFFRKPKTVFGIASTSNIPSENEVLRQFLDPDKEPELMDMVRPIWDYEDNITIGPFRKNEGEIFVKNFLTGLFGSVNAKEIKADLDDKSNEWITFGPFMTGNLIIIGDALLKFEFSEKDEVNRFVRERKWLNQDEILYRVRLSNMNKPEPENPEECQACKNRAKSWNGYRPPEVFDGKIHVLSDNGHPICGGAAMQRANELMSTRIVDHPPLARKYTKYLSGMYGACGELYVTALAHYAQAVEGLSCYDSLYLIDEKGIEFFSAQNERVKGEHS